MSIVQAMLCGLIYYLGNSSILAGPVGYYTVYRPLIAGFLTGCVLGDPVTGTMIGATINLMYIGFISAGGALPGDMCLAGVLGTALGITGGLSTEAALAIAVPLGLLGTLLWFGRLTIDSFFMRIADKMIEKGEADKIWIPDLLLPQLMLFVVTGGSLFPGLLFRCAVCGGSYQCAGRNRAEYSCRNRRHDAGSRNCHHAEIYFQGRRQEFSFS